MNNDEKLSLCCYLNNKGISLEKSGKIKAAIKIYEQNIELRYQAHHSFKRLMVLYRKLNDINNEIRVIGIALEVFPNYPEYLKRLHKIDNGKFKQNGY